MANFNQKLSDILKKDLRFIDQDGDLLKSEVVDKAWKVDHKLIELLLDDKEVKQKFFSEIKGHWVFNVSLFVEFVQDKNFLNDSYTKFKNKIGLTIDGKHLNQRGEVALAWPYKDCVLEGGMSDEENGKEEIFFNEVLAQDEIDRLLDSKVLANGKRFDASGEKKFDGFSRDENGLIKDNLIIKGNNLLALHSLKKEFGGKVKFVYIDPPYNTGGDGFRYNDRFNHSTWLTFMKNRLEVTRELLRDDGAIFISCDDNEQAYLKVLMDEVFGRENFIANIVAQTNPRGRTLDKFLAKTCEYILAYSKREGQESLYQIPKGEKALKEYRKEDDGGKYRELELRNRNPVFNRENRPNLFYPFYIDPKTDTVSLKKDAVYCETALPQNSKLEDGCWTWGKEKAEKNIDLLVGRKTSTGAWRVYRKDYIPEGGAFTKEKALWLDKNINHENGKEELGRLFGKTPFSFPKSVELIKKCLQVGTKKGERHIVLDFHAGSGTTAQSVLELNKEDSGDRQFILVEQMDYIEDVTNPRVQKVIEQLGEGSFVYFELKKYNEAFIGQIQSAKKTADLEEIWEEMKSKSFLNWNVDFRRADLAFEDWKQLDFEKQQHALIELLNKNQLYVNLSEIDDKNFKCTDKERKLSAGFYNSELQ